MKRSIRQGLLILTSAMALLVAGCGQSEKVGTVDFEKVARESGQAQQITQEINAKQQEIVARLQQAQATLPEAEFKAKEEAAKHELQIFQMSKKQQFEALVQSQAALIAKEKKLGIIMHQQAVHANGVDITDELIAKMKAQSGTKPAAKTETKTEAKK